MPKTCCIPGCKSNYNSTLKAGKPQVSTFSLPKNEVLRGKWLKAIPRNNWSPTKYSVVCGLHFPESDIIREDKLLLPDGTVTKIPTKTRLSPDAVPSIFPNLPHYLSKKVPLPRKSPDERRLDNLARNDNLNEIFEQSDLISNFEDLILNYSSKINISDSWSIKIASDNNKIYFYILNFAEEYIKITNQITVNRDMLVTVFLNEKKLSYNDLSWILPFNLKLSRWSEIENLLIRYKDPSDRVDQSFTYLIEKSLCYLNEASNKISPEMVEDYLENQHTSLNNLNILIDQIKLLI
jgi:hypothetical protein